MLKLTKLGKKFGDKIAVNEIDLEVREGEIFGFLGPNGAGKSTTINMIVGILEPDLGTIELDGMNVVENRLEAKKRFSYVPDNPDIYPNITGIDYLNFMADIYEIPTDVRKERIDYYAEKFGLTEALPNFADSFSHGMKQKLVLIAALMHDPDLFILDEPMVGLDPKSSFTLKELMREHCNKGNTVFFSTHVMEVAEKICDRIAIINKGNIIAVGTMDEIRAQFDDQGTLEEIFLELTES